MWESDIESQFKKITVGCSGWCVEGSRLAVEVILVRAWWCGLGQWGGWCTKQIWKCSELLKSCGRHPWGREWNGMSKISPGCKSVFLALSLELLFHCVPTSYFTCPQNLTAPLPSVCPIDSPISPTQFRQNWYPPLPAILTIKISVCFCWLFFCDVLEILNLQVVPIITLLQTLILLSELL